MIIALEGTDGTGKATQARLLQEALQANGFSIATLHFPRYNDPSSLLLRYYLEGLFGPADAVPPKVASAFFAFDRLMAAPVIRELMAAHDIVVLDRYVGSNKGHQLGKLTTATDRRNFLNWLNELEYERHGIARPDLTLLLWLPVAGRTTVDSSGTKGGVRNDIHESDPTHLPAAENGYGWAARHDQYENWQIIPCQDESGRRLTPIELHDLIWQTVTTFLKVHDIVLSCPTTKMA